jgi:hypothetical protein
MGLLPALPEGAVSEREWRKPVPGTFALRSEPVTDADVLREAARILDTLGGGHRYAAGDVLRTDAAALEVVVEAKS